MDGEDEMEAVYVRCVMEADKGITSVDSNLQNDTLIRSSDPNVAGNTIYGIEYRYRTVYNRSPIKRMAMTGDDRRKIQK